MFKRGFNSRYIFLFKRDSHHAQTDLNKKFGAIHQTLISFNIDSQEFRKTKNENPPSQEIEVNSEAVPAHLPMVGRSASTD